MKSAGGDLGLKGWTRLPVKFKARELEQLSKLGPHIGRGQRLTDMQALAKALPEGFRDCVANLGFQTRPNRAIGFVKSKDSNWSLPWHQDRVIAMPEKIDDPQYSNWTRKSGIWHCEPTAKLLRHMVFAYIAFDEIIEGMGGLEVAEGTHLCGKISKEEIESYLSNAKLTNPDMTRGDVLLISALTLHRSAVITEMGQRRTLRMDFAKKAD